MYVPKFKFCCMCFVHALSGTRCVHVGCALPALPSCRSPPRATPRIPLLSSIVFPVVFPDPVCIPDSAPGRACLFPPLPLPPRGNQQVRAGTCEHCTSILPLFPEICAFLCHFLPLSYFFLGFCVSVLNPRFISGRPCHLCLVKFLSLLWQNVPGKYSLTFLSSLLLSPPLSHAGAQRLGRRVWG